MLIPPGIGAAAILIEDRNMTIVGVADPCCAASSSTLDLKAAVKRVVAERGVSEAEIIREAIRVSVGRARPRPRGGRYSSAQPIARDAEEMLTGFGER